MKTPYDTYDYEAYWQDRDFEDCCERAVLEKIFSLIPAKADKTLVDIGGGFGRLSGFYGPVFKKSLVIDPSEKLLKIGRKRSKEKRVSFKQGSLPCLPLDKESFDVALIVRVSHHLNEPEECLREVARVLKPGGFLVFEVANKIHFLARLRAFFSGDFGFTRDTRPIERRSRECIAENLIPFLNHHPKKIIADLKRQGFGVKAIFSVSNFRSPLLKKVLPKSLLVFLEKKLQQPLGRFFFGPSIFILAKKVA